MQTVKNDNMEQNLYVMMYTLHSLNYIGISITETVLSSLKRLLFWYRESSDARYLEEAELHMRAYANMGYALDDGHKEISELLELLGKKGEDFYPCGFVLGKRIKLTKTQVRSMIGKWKPSKENPMTISQVVDDIIAKVSAHQEGRYVYKYSRKSSGQADEPEIYELVVNSETCYFYDVNNFRFYTLITSPEDID